KLQNIITMNIKSINFEEVLKNYINYHKTIDSLNDDKNNFSMEMEKIKNEIDSILESSKSFILDDSTKAMNQERLKNLQIKARKLESEFRESFQMKQSSEFEKNFLEINEIVKNWAMSQNIDLVLNRDTLVYSKLDDITNNIIDVLKDQ